MKESPKAMDKTGNKESSPEDAGMNIYKWPAALITTYQMSPGDWAHPL